MEKYINQIRRVLDIIDISPIQSKTEVTGRLKKDGRAISVMLTGDAHSNQLKVDYILRMGA